MTCVSDTGGSHLMKPADGRMNQPVWVHHPEPLVVAKALSCSSVAPRWLPHLWVHTTLAYLHISTVPPFQVVSWFPCLEMPFHAHICMCPHTSFMGCGVLIQLILLASTSLCPAMPHQTSSSCLPQLFFLSGNVTDTPTPTICSHHHYLSSPSKTKEEALLCFIMAFRLYFWLLLFLLPLGFVSSMDCEGFAGKDPLSALWPNHPTASGDTDIAAPKSGLCEGEKYSWGQLSFKYWICFRLDT